MGRKFPGKSFQIFGYTSGGSPLFRKFCENAIFYSALVPSGWDYSELDISCNDDGDGYSKMDQ